MSLAPRHRMACRGAAGPRLTLQCMSGGTKRATCVNVPLLRLQSSEDQFAMSREIEPVRRSFCRRRSCTSTEVARLEPSRSADDHLLSCARQGCTSAASRCRSAAMAALVAFVRARLPSCETLPCTSTAATSLHSVIWCCER